MTSATSTKIEHALALAEKGFRVFPLRPNSKIPPKDMFFKKAATTDPDMIRQWWRENPDYNIGVATGDGTLVVDADVKKGAQGLSSLELLDLIGLPDSYRVSTPSGGAHVYLRTTHAHHQILGKLNGFPGIDIKCEGNYVLGPGSVVDGKPYVVTRDAEIEASPDFFDTMLIENTPRRKERHVDPLVELDLPENIEAATRWLIEYAPEAIEGSYGDIATYKVACGVRDRGVSEDTALTLMLEHWNESKAIPPWDPEDLSGKIASAYRSAQNAPGSALPSAEFEAFPDLDVGEPPSRRRVPRKRGFHTISLAEAVKTALSAGAPPLVHGLIDQGTAALIYGPPGAGKTFVSMDIAAAVASGRNWNGRKVRQGVAMYIAAEGDGGTRKRFAALVKGGRAAEDAPLRLAPCSVDIFARDGDTEAVIREAQAITEQAGEPVRLIVIDTLARAMGGGDENSGQDMGALVRNVDRIRTETGATVLAVHHTGKDIQRGGRGHSSLKAALDTEIELTWKAETKIGAFITRKQRDLPLLDAPIPYRLHSIELGIDGHGRRVSSCVVDYGGAAEFGPIEVTPRAERFAGSLAEAVATACGPVDWGTWLETHYRAVDPKWREGTPPPSGCSLQNLRKLRAELTDAARVAADASGKYRPADDL